jgi:hypothetical protein
MYVYYRSSLLKLDELIKKNNLIDYYKISIIDIPDTFYMTIKELEEYSINPKNKKIYCNLEKNMIRITVKYPIIVNIELLEDHINNLNFSPNGRYEKDYVCKNLVNHDCDLGNISYYLFFDILISDIDKIIDDLMNILFYIKGLIKN